MTAKRKPRTVVVWLVVDKRNRKRCAFLTEEAACMCTNWTDGERMVRCTGTLPAAKRGKK
jgi:hypothetical protein